MAPWRVLFALSVLAVHACGPEVAAQQAGAEPTGRLFSVAPGAIAPSAETTAELWSAYLARGQDYQPRTEHLQTDGRPTYINRLILEDSPYLIQHAHNPVDWYPWGEEAFAKAQREGKPIFLSIGYSTCHWCHVMERESFEDETVARVLNENFVSIKVDREQRPDVDDVYMTAVQLTSGRGGWPMTSLLTSDGKPFFGATYFPKKQLTQLLERAVVAWQAQRPQLIAQAEQVAEAVARVTSASGAKGTVVEENFEAAVKAIVNRQDQELGGFSPAPKFPHEPELLFLLERALREDDSGALAAAANSLDHMARGGIYDQVGGGFHRYSTDKNWLVPHFEKMLYNQALLARAYLLSSRLRGAQQEAGSRLEERVARQTLDYVLRDMTSPAGGFYSATDADSEGKEGRFFVWTPAEIQAALPAKDADLFVRVFGVTEKGNFEGKNILSLQMSLSDWASKLQIPLGRLLTSIDQSREALYQRREHRIHPLRDEKIVTEWNAMMITTLALAGDLLDEDRYLGAAKRAANFLWRANRKEDGTLWRAHLDGSSSVAANQSDYAYLLEGLITLYDATNDDLWLERARSVADVMIERFWDDADGGFFMSADDHGGRLLVRPKSPTDGATPSGNSVAVRALAMLSSRVGDDAYRRKALATVSAFAAQIVSRPTAFGYLLLGADELINGASGPLEYGGHGAVRAEAKWSDRSVEDSTIEVHVRMAPGWHINASKPQQETLIATRLALRQGGEAISMEDVEYPLAETVTLGFQDQPLAVYQGEVKLSASVAFSSEERPIAARFELTVQACDDRRCLLPEVLGLEVPTRH